MKKKYRWNKERFALNVVKFEAIILSALFADAWVIYYLYFM